MRGTPELANDAALSAAIRRRVKMKRIALGLTVGEAARRVGLTSAQFSRFEKGHGNPTASTMERAMASVGVTLWDLTGGMVRPRPPHAVDYGALLADTPPRDTPSNGSTGLMLIDWEDLDG